MSQQQTTTICDGLDKTIGNLGIYDGIHTSQEWGGTIDTHWMAHHMTGVRLLGTQLHQQVWEWE